MDKADNKTGKRSVGSSVAAQIVGLLVCIGLPAFITAIAPVSWITFQRGGDQVSARARTCLFFIIPFKTVTITPVTSVGRRTNTGSTTIEKRRGRQDIRRQSEAEGFLSIEGPDQSAEVPVTPYNLKSVTEKSDAFLKDPKATELKLFVVANWKFSVIVGGFASLLTVLYVGAAGFTLVRGLLRMMGLGGAKAA